jgi:N-acetylglucosaminyl-diphospho-decaprenol L-rhamnosyltransferase
MAPTLSVIIVSWNVRDLLEQALDAVLTAGTHTPDLEIIVVDSASSDGTPEAIRIRYPQVRLIASDENLGFAKGNNRGIVEAHGDFLLLLNADTVVRGDALAILINYLQEHPNVGMVGPRILNADETTQSSRRRYPTLPVLFLESTWLQSLAPRQQLDHFYVADIADSEEQIVDWITGAAMLVRREVLNDIGGLDEGFFMYSEELDWCHRIGNAGWKIAYTPAAEIVHYGGKSSEQVAPARHIYFQSSKVRYTLKYHGRLAAETLRYWLLSQYAWQSAVEGLKWLAGHRRELRTARIVAYRRVIRSGLRQTSAIAQPPAKS